MDSVWSGFAVDAVVVGVHAAGIGPVDMARTPAVGGCRVTGLAVLPASGPARLSDAVGVVAVQSSAVRVDGLRVSGNGRDEASAATAAAASEPMMRERGWAHEVERHSAIKRRLEALLADLGQTLDGPDEDR